MGLFDGLFQNPAVKQMAFGQLRKLFQGDKAPEMIVVKVDAETDDLKIDIYYPGEVVLTRVNPTETTDKPVLENGNNSNTEIGVNTPAASDTGAATNNG